MQAFYPSDIAPLGGMVWMRFEVCLTDAKGVGRVIGNSHFGLMLDYESTVDAEMGGQRGRVFTLLEKLPVPSARVG